MAGQGKRILVSIATYNERGNIESLIGEIHRHLPAADVLIIDDDSPDGTGDLADRLAGSDDHLKVIHRKSKQGLGTAVLAGMQFAMEKDYDLFISMDADFSHHPRYLPHLVSGMAEHDIMIGSRYVTGGGTRDWPLSRRVLSKGVNLMCRCLLRLPARDCSGGMRCYRVGALREAKLDSLYSNGYSFMEEVLYRCCKSGCTVGEVPIVFIDRKNGASKANAREMVRSLSILIFLALQASFAKPIASPR